MMGLKQLLTPPKKGFQYWMTLSGVLTGIITSVLALVLVWDIKAGTGSEHDVFGDNTLVIQKEVSSLTSLGLNATEFTDAEIRSLKSKDYILEVAPFKTANYEVGISENPGDGLPGFYAEMFLQSVPNSFIDDLDSSVWYWQSEADVVPIILPRDFLTLVNYGIAPSKGMPQISEDLIKSVRLQLHLIGKNKKGIVLGRVVGFSSKIASVLVPDSFINYSNNKYGFKKSGQPSRLLIKTEPKSYTQINTLIKELNLSVSENDLSVAKISTYLIQMIMLFFIFAFIILVLSVLALLQYLQITLMQLQYEVNLLIKLGYQPNSIIRVIRQQFTKIIVVLSAIALGVVFLIKGTVIQPFLTSAGIDGTFMGYIFGILFVIVLITACLIVLQKSVYNTILKIYKKG